MSRDTYVEDHPDEAAAWALRDIADQLARIADVLERVYPKPEVVTPSPLGEFTIREGGGR